ncbi:hypothetical protein NM688_g4391 [Phlebia brevispora]|uniref:Uncharacterized protein n=1 Tax=Phlebia brevispora TaxID=194682 RepID=A0ACC1T388_9APHY|nr:hypothetical protein NM688_g4391 [Phlebia brevispora]
MSFASLFARPLRVSPNLWSLTTPCHAVARPGPQARLMYRVPRNSACTFSTSRVHLQFSTRQKSFAGFYKVAGVAGLGLGISLWGGAAGSEIHCDAVSETGAMVPTTAPSPATLPPPPESSVNLYELTFGTVCGVCAGVFMKKGAKALAFVLGGIFVLLQYLGSLSLVRVDWTRMSGRFENLFYREDVQGIRRPPSIGSVMRWLIDFLTADFQQRASFVAGFALGLRVG